MTVDFIIAKKNLNLKNVGMGNFHFQKMIKIIYQNEKGFNSNSQLTFKLSDDEKLAIIKILSVLLKSYSKAYVKSQIDKIKFIMFLFLVIVKSKHKF